MGTPTRRALLAGGVALMAAAPAAAAVLPDAGASADAELLAACAAFTHAREEVARLERIADVPDDVFEPANDALHDAVVRVSRLRAHTVAGVQAKAAVCRAVLAADEPAAMAGTFGGPARRHDVMMGSLLSDLVEVAG